MPLCITSHARINPKAMLRAKLFIALLALFACSAFATQVKEIKIKRNADSIDVLLSISESYSQRPKLTQQDNYTGIILPKLHAPSHNQTFKNSFLNQVQIFNIQDNLYILGIGNPQITKASMSKSHNTLRVSFTKTTQNTQLDELMNKSFNVNVPDLATSAQVNAVSQDSQPMQNPQNTQTNAQNLPFKNDLGIDTWRYVALIIIMLALIIGLFIIKRFMLKKKQFRQFLGEEKTPSFDLNEVQIISQTNIDSKNRILTIESNGTRYLVLIGATGTTLLDRYPIPQKISQSEQIVFDDQFTKLLEQKQERLSQYLHDDRQP